MTHSRECARCAALNADSDIAIRPTRTARNVYARTCVYGTTCYGPQIIREPYAHMFVTRYLILSDAFRLSSYRRDDVIRRPCRHREENMIASRVVANRRSKIWSIALRPRVRQCWSFERDKWKSIWSRPRASLNCIHTTPVYARNHRVRSFVLPPHTRAVNESYNNTNNETSFKNIIWNFSVR